MIRRKQMVLKIVMLLIFITLMSYICSHLPEVYLGRKSRDHDCILSNRNVMDDEENGSNEPQTTQKVPPLSQILALCLTIIAQRHDSMVEKNFIAVLTN